MFTLFALFILFTLFKLFTLFRLLPLLTLFAMCIPLKLLYTALSLACMPVYSYIWLEGYQNVDLWASEQICGIVAWMRDTPLL